MRRREFITLLGSATAAWPLAARAQQSERKRRIGVLMAHTEWIYFGFSDGLTRAIEPPNLREAA